MTVQNLYTQYLDGKITKQKFLYEVRRDQNLTMISPSNSFDDVVKILKNKSIISEKASKESTGKQEVDIIAKTIDMVNPYEYTKGMEYELGVTDVPATSGDLSEENVVKAQKKVLTNLTKNPRYYTEKMCGKREVSEEWVEVTKKEMDKIGKGKKDIMREGIHDQDITSASHTNVKGEMGDYNPKARAANLNKLKNFGPKEGDVSAIKIAQALQPLATKEEIKQYFQSLFKAGDKFETVEDYVEDFKNYIADKSLEEGLGDAQYWKAISKAAEKKYGSKEGVEKVAAAMWKNVKEASTNESTIYSDALDAEIKTGDILKLKNGTEVRVGAIPTKDNPKYGKGLIIATDLSQDGKGNLTIDINKDVVKEGVELSAREQEIVRLVENALGIPSSLPVTEAPAVEDEMVEENPLNTKKAVKNFLKKEFKELSDKEADYLANKWAEKVGINEIERPGFNSDGTPKSNDEMSDDEREEFYNDSNFIEEHGQYADRVADVNADSSPLKEEAIYEKYAQKMGKTVDEVKAMVKEAKAKKLEEADDTPEEKKAKELEIAAEKAKIAASNRKIQDLNQGR